MENMRTLYPGKYSGYFESEEKAKNQKRYAVRSSKWGWSDEKTLLETDDYETAKCLFFKIKNDLEIVDLKEVHLYDRGLGGPHCDEPALSYEVHVDGEERQARFYTQIRKCGNSLGIFATKEIEALGAKIDDEVEIRLRIVPKVPEFFKRISNDEMMKQIEEYAQKENISVEELVSRALEHMIKEANQN